MVLRARSDGPRIRALRRGRYQIKLDEDDDLIWAPQDHDGVVRLLAEDADAESDEDDDVEDADDAMDGGLLEAAAVDVTEPADAHAGHDHDHGTGFASGDRVQKTA